MTEHTVERLLVMNKAQCHLIDELLIQVMALEGSGDSLILIPDSLEPILILAPGGNLLVEIVDGMDDVAAQAIAEDQVEGVVRRRVMVEEGGVFGVARELYEEGEDIMDVLRQVEVWDREILRYPVAPDYDDLNYIPDRQI